MSEPREPSEPRRAPPASPNADSTALIPRDGGLGALWLSAAAIGLMILGGVALAVLRPFRSLDASRPVAASSPTAARLTITADVAADAFVDGSYVRPTPVVALELPPGRHVVRVQPTAPGRSLVPRQQTIELHSGEQKALQLLLQ
jgi:hypothetical protein